MENVNQSNYLGKEKLSKLLAQFAIPCILSLIISCLYNIVDQNFVGKIVGKAGNAALMSFLSGVLIIAIAYIGGDGLLVLLGAKDAETLQLASAYGKIIYIMMPLALAQNCLAAIIRADGSPKVAMAAMFTGAILNIIGDPIFISFMGISGAAAATILGQFVSFLMCAAYLSAPKTLR